MRSYQKNGVEMMRGAGKLKHFVIIYSFSVFSVASKLLEVKDYVLFAV